MHIFQARRLSGTILFPRFSGVGLLLYFPEVPLFRSQGWSGFIIAVHAWFLQRKNATTFRGVPVWASRHKERAGTLASRRARFQAAQLPSAGHTQSSFSKASLGFA